jgi:CMP/dCMP kinase
MTTNPVSVTIDGPTASGKTTLGMELSREFGMTFFDSGLTFRALAFAAYHDLLGDREDWRGLIVHLPCVWKGASQEQPEQPEAIIVDGHDVSDEIFAPALEPYLKKVAANDRLRQQIKQLHRDIVGSYSAIVVVGRDVAVTTLPDAPVHVALWASLPVRRERRRAQYLNYPERSAAVGPATPRDHENLEAICRMKGGVIIDSTYLRRDAVSTVVSRRIMER